METEIIQPIEKNKQKISFSEYSTYIQCQHRWYLNYYLKLPSEVSEELIFGSALHASIEEILCNKILQRLYKVDKQKVIRDIFRSTLKDELSRVEDVNFLTKFKNQNLGQIFMFQAEKLISALDFFQRFKSYKVVEVEHKLEGIKIAENDEVEILYKGFIDIVLQHIDDLSYLIIDWKTSRKPWDIVKKLADNKNLFAQLCLYKKFYSTTQNIPFKDIDTKFYNFPRDEPSKQAAYAGNLKEEFVDDFIQHFIQTCFKIYEHKKSLKNFEKIKMVTKQNFCYRCPYNVPQYCNDIDQYQTVTV